MSAAKVNLAGPCHRITRGQEVGGVPDPVGVCAVKAPPHPTTHVDVRVAAHGFGERQAGQLRDFRSKAKLQVEEPDAVALCSRRCSVAVGAQCAARLVIYRKVPDEDGTLSPNTGLPKSSRPRE